MTWERGDPARIAAAVKVESQRVEESGVKRISKRVMIGSRMKFQAFVGLLGSWTLNDDTLGMERSRERFMQRRKAME